MSIETTTTPLGFLRPWPSLAMCQAMRIHRLCIFMNNVYVDGDSVYVTVISGRRKNMHPAAVSGIQKCA